MLLSKRPLPSVGERVFFAIVGLLLAVHVASAQRNVPSDNLGYPVLITFPGISTGSGFFFTKDQTVYLVTAKHVLFKPRPAQDITAKSPDPFELQGKTCTLIAYSKDPADLTKYVLTLDLEAMEKASTVKRHASQDIAVVKIFTLAGSIATGAEVDSQVVPGVTITQRGKQALLGLSSDDVKTFDKVLTGNDVMVFGYPGSIGLKNLPQIDYERPLLRKGIVAGTNPAQRSIILDCPIYFGNSGGLVLEIDRDAFTVSLKGIGVITQYIPFNQTASSETIGITVYGNSGYAVAVPMDFVLELMK